MVRIAQLVRASDCGSEGRGFESHFSPVRLSVKVAFFVSYSLEMAIALFDNKKYYRNPSLLQIIFLSLL